MKISQEEVFIKFLKLLDDNNCLEHVLVVGSWVEHLYQSAGVLPNNITVLYTYDLDFLVRNPRKPSPPISLPAVARLQ